MRNPRFLSAIYIFLAIGISSSAVAQQLSYVVIGAFAIHENAVRFTVHARNQKMDAKFEMNPNRKLYYVFVMVTPDHSIAILEAKRLRRETGFSDAWVYKTEAEKPEVIFSKPGVDINPVTEKKMEKVVVADSSSVSNLKVVQPTPSPQTKANNLDSKIEGKYFFFKIFRGTDNATVNGDVDVIDMERSRKMGTYKGNVSVKVPKPSSKSGKISFVCQAFGYRKVQKDIEFENPQGEDITIDSNNVVVPFELVRLQKGDIAVMYNVFFFNDAGIMRPESHYEVNSLLSMLQENPTCKIRIHGHTNGGAPGKIISMGESRNFFTLSNDNKTGIGSAKGLSEERAKTIKAYLVSQGIDESRMQVKAWGGKRPIHEKNSNRAQENVRVEIEILEK